MRLTQKQEAFTLNLFQGMSQREAYVRAGYSGKQSPATIDRHACELAKTDKVVARWEELRLAAQDASIANVVERKQRLTEILRANVPDYVDNGVVRVDKDSPNVGAVSEITTKTKVYQKQPIVITNLKLHNPIPAIVELNKMEKVYTEGSTVNIDNRKIEILVNSEQAKQLTEQIIKGDNT